MKWPIIFGIWFILLLAIPASATIINVPADQPTIQAGINASVDGDTVLVSGGEYYESVIDNEINGITLMTLEGAKIIGGGGQGIALTNVSNWVISGFEVTGCTDRGVFLGNCTEVIVEKCQSHHITQGEHTHGFGVNLSSDVILRHNIASSNSKAGIWIWNSANTDIINNTVVFNGWDGIIFSFTGAGNIVKNNISVGNLGHGIEFQNENGAYPDPEAVSYNDSWNNGENYGGCESSIGGISSDPLFTGGDLYDYHLQEYSPCIDAGDPDPRYNDPDETRNDMGAFYYHQGPRIWHVSVEGDDVSGDGSEANPFATIQHGIDMASNRDTILVHSGVYIGDGNQNISVNGKNLLLKGEMGRENTTIGQVDSPTSITIAGQNVDTSMVVDGITIINGSITVDGTAPTLRNLNINNDLSLIGIQVFSDFNLLPVTIINCNFNQCETGLYYAISVYNSPIQVRNCTFTANNFGIRAASRTPSFCGNTVFIDNGVGFQQYGGGSGSSRWEIDSCLFDGNETALFGSFIILNSVIKNSDYGVICNFANYGAVSNCLFENISIRIFFSHYTGMRDDTEDEDILDYWGNIVVSNSVIHNNPGEIANIHSFVEDPIGLVLDNCVISDNGGGINVTNTMYFRMIKCLYANNDGPIYYDGIGSSYSDRLTIAGTVIENNVDGISMRFGYNPHIPLQIFGNIIFNNSGTGFKIEIEDEGIECTPIEFSDVFNNAGGNYVGIPDQTGIYGNISEDPLFVDPQNRDFHLQCSSPCVDTGNPDSLDADGSRSDMGAYCLPHYFAPTPATAIAPPDDSEVDSLTWLTWLESSDADTICNVVSYNMQIDEDPNFGGPEVNAILLPGRRLNLDETISYQLRAIPGWQNLMDDSVYFWRLKSIDEVGDTSSWTDGSSYFFYNLANSVPSPPTDGFSPSNGEEVISLAPTITWNHGSDPDPGDNAENLRYSIKLSQNEDFSGFVYYDTTDPGINQIQPIEELDDNSHYFYGVMTIDDGGLASGWSATQDFWTNHYNFPPEPFPIYEPEDSTMQVVYYTHFSWGNTVDYDPMSSFTFTFEYSTNDQFNNPVISIEGLTQTALTIETDSLALLGSSLYWRVKAVDDDGLIRIGGISDEEVRFLKILPPGDANSSGSVNIADVIYLFSFLRGMGNPPDPLLAGDANGNCMVNIADVIYLFSFLKGDGNPPIRGDCEGIRILIEKKPYEKEK